MASLTLAGYTHCFYTVTSGNKPGASNIADRNGRKKRDEPFNPFAPNASAQRNKRQTDRKNVERRPATTRPAAPQTETPSGMTELAKKQKQAMERMKRQQGGSQKSAQPSTVAPKETVQPTITSSVATSQPPKPQVSHDDRLAELRRKSELSRQNAKLNAKPVESSLVEAKEPEVAPAQSDLTGETTIEAKVVEANSTSSQLSKVKQNSKDVFKTIQTAVPKSTGDRRRKRRRHDKKGGGRQKQEKKLNRQKYLEYKYAAREILDNPNIPEEHRSNILGQVWAKGERIGVTDSIEFIEQKVSEEILPEDAAKRLRELVSRMTTRR